MTEPEKTITRIINENRFEANKTQELKKKIKKTLTNRFLYAHKAFAIQQQQQQQLNEAISFEYLFC